MPKGDNVRVVYVDDIDEIIRQHFAEQNGDAAYRKDADSTGTTAPTTSASANTTSPAAGSPQRHTPESSDSGSLTPESQGDGRIATPAAILACSICMGSGEGYTKDQICWNCKGSGLIDYAP